MSGLYYYFVRFLLSIVFLLFTRRQVKGRENIPKKGPLLVVANHVSMVDPPLVAVVFNRRLKFMAKEELFRSWFLGFIVGNLGVFPVQRGKPNREALRRAEAILAKGQALVIFPEGTRSRDVRLQAALHGAAQIARRGKAPLIPVAIAVSRNPADKRWFLKRPRVVVNIGRPFYLPPADDKLAKERRVELTNLIMKRIAELLPAEHRGDYGELVTADDAS